MTISFPLESPKGRVDIRKTGRPGSRFSEVNSNRLYEAAVDRAPALFN